MPSSVGFQKTDEATVEQAAKLEMDCVRAYSVAAQAAHSPQARDVYAQMSAECALHVEAWQLRLVALQQPRTRSNRCTEWANGAKAQAAAVFGDRALALAVRNNAADRISAYTKVETRHEFSAVTLALAAGLLPDARKHFEWVEKLAQGHTAEVSSTL